ncbi:MAG: aryldialkylphosphatase [Acidobacteria bacterium]|nr:aryldialkylphosphatase [Acidobacteriota bacterium]
MRQEDILQDRDHRLPASLTGKIQTVTGLIDPGTLGVCLTHEHLLVDLSELLPPPNRATARAFYARPMSAEAAAYCRNYSDFGTAHHRLDSVETAVEELGLFKQHGGQAMVELTLSGIYRDPVGLRRISRASGVQVVMGCGFYVAAAHPPELSGWREEQITDMIVADIVEGAASEEESRTTAKGLVRRTNTGVRAGVIGEIGCSSPLHDNERKCLRAAAQAQRQTGACIFVHPGREERAPLEILDELSAAGADLVRVVIAHLDRTVFNRDTLQKIAETGAYLSYDLFGNYSSGFYPHNPTVQLLNDAGRVADIRWMIEQGWTEQILISHDICQAFRLTKWGGHGYHYILAEIVPRMRMCGVSEAEIDQILVGNPRALLTIVAPRDNPA